MSARRSGALIFRDLLAEKVTFHDEPADLGVQTFDLARAVGPAITIVVFEMLASRAREAASSRRKFGSDAPDSLGARSATVVCSRNA
jgi:hypothetical protein